MDTIQTQFVTDNNSKSINARVTVLALCTLILVDICMKIHEDSLKDFQAIEWTGLRRDLVMVKFPREITQKYKCKSYGTYEG